jgi:hypothetical protein
MCRQHTPLAKARNTQLPDDYHAIQVPALGSHRDRDAVSHMNQESQIIGSNHLFYKDRNSITASFLSIVLNSSFRLGHALLRNPF